LFINGTKKPLLDAEQNGNQEAAKEMRKNLPKQ
jgi:hypothetical protein